MEDKNLQLLKERYLKTPIPQELDSMVNKALEEGRRYTMKRRNIFKRTGVVAASIAIFAAVLAVGINSSPTFASTLTKVPVVGNIAKVLNFREYIVNEDGFNADIKVPAVEGLENTELESSLNEKYFAENKKLYEEFMAEMEKMKQEGGGHLGVDSGYVVKTDTDRILSIGRYVVNTAGSSSTIFKYDTIDRQEGILITLPSLFKGSSYVEIISENIKQQMLEQMKADENIIYWVDMEGEEDTAKAFEKISPAQNFYINEEGKLVISFDEYEVAPGYMGVQEFIIPTEVISGILVSNTYIK